MRSLRSVLNGAARVGRALAFCACAAGAAAAGLGCQDSPEPVQLHGQVRLTLLHTSDIHSRLFPYAFQITQADAALGLGAPDTVATVGGAAQMSYIVQRERARADRVLHLDSGDVFQGAPVFNYFHGEAEVQFMNNFGLDAMVVGNHEFDLGARNVGTQFQNWGGYPLLAANYLVEDYHIEGTPALARVLQPFTVINANGLRVAIVGMGDLSSMTSLFEKPNKLGLAPLATAEIAQAYVDMLRPYVDLVVMLSHLGINDDVWMVERTTGIDVVLGGHNHIALQPPKVVEDCKFWDEQAQSHYVELASPKGSDEGEAPMIKRYCVPRKVIIAHSGAFAKYVGRLDLVLSDRGSDVGAHYDPINGFEVLSHEYQLFPVTEDVPHDPRVVRTLEPYKQALPNLIDLDMLIGYAPEGVKRASPNGGDSALGNMVATAALLRVGIQTDFSLTNTTGLRADMVPGPVSIDQMFNIFPFENSITKMQLSGVEVQDLFDFVARRSAGRGCKSQAQIAGARVVINCGECQRPDAVKACTSDADCPDSSCNLATQTCERAPCAEHIYIGATSKTCMSDADCGEGALGSCDKGTQNAVGHCWQPLNLVSSYELATSNYLAQGGSGYRVLQRNTTQSDTKVQQRDALIDFVREGKPCGFDPAHGTDDGLKVCSTDADCRSLGDEYSCACTEGVTEDPSTGQCRTSSPCAEGRCVLSACRNDVAAFHRRICESVPSEAMRQECEHGLNACQQAGETCKFLACIDPALGNFTDGRLMMLAN